MKNLFKVVLFTLLITSPCIVYSAERAGVANLVEGSVWVIRSNVEYATIDGDAEISKQEIKTKDIIFANDTIITEDDGKVEILFDDSTVLSIANNSQIEIDEFVYNPQKQADPSFVVRVVDGVARVISGKIVEQNPDKFKVKAPLANVGIRGTMTVHSVVEGDEKHYVLELGSGHEVAVGAEKGTSETILKESGYFLDVTSSEIPKEATKLSDEEIESLLMMTSVKVANSDGTFNPDLMRPDYSNIIRTIRERELNNKSMPTDRSFANQNKSIK